MEEESEVPGYMVDEGDVPGYMHSNLEKENIRALKGSRKKVILLMAWPLRGGGGGYRAGH